MISVTVINLCMYHRMLLSAQAVCCCQPRLCNQR
jgi:hypothetical protein